MGLDDVRLLMAVEEEFDVDIPQAKTARMRTVGHLYSFLKVHASCGIPDADAEIWRRLVKVISFELNCPSEDVTPEADFAKDLGLG